MIPISARDGDGVAARTAAIDWYAGPTIVEALDRLAPARQLDELPLRLPIQAVYKFDDRRIVAGRVESGSLKAGDEIVIMPAGKIARVKTVEGWPLTPVSNPQRAGRSVGTLNLYSKQPDTYTAHQARYLELMTANLGVTLVRVAAFEPEPADSLAVVAAAPGRIQ